MKSSVFVSDFIAVVFGGLVFRRRKQPFRKAKMPADTDMTLTRFNREPSTCLWQEATSSQRQPRAQGSRRWGKFAAVIEAPLAVDQAERAPSKEGGAASFRSVWSPALAYGETPDATVCAAWSLFTRKSLKGRNSGNAE